MAQPQTLPPLRDVLSVTGTVESTALLDQALSILFEPSTIITLTVLPQVANDLATGEATVSSYEELIDVAITATLRILPFFQARFIRGHPRIGEVNNLSQLSAMEQAAVATPPAVLARLAHLNACYERRYPEMIYITFVNGRTRAEIMEELEGVLGVPHSLEPDTPPVESFESLDREGDEWKRELKRAVEDVGRIAKSRLKVLGA